MVIETERLTCIGRERWLAEGATPPGTSSRGPRTGAWGDSANGLDASHFHPSYPASKPFRRCARRSDLSRTDLVRGFRRESRWWQGMSDRARRLGLRTARVTALALALVALSYPLVEPARSSALARRAQPLGTALTPSRLAQDLRDGARAMRVPADLHPSLARARLPISVGCGLGRAAVRSKPCVWGDVTSRTTVVLFGDSHAGMWLSALAPLGRQHRWRVIDLTKSGCPPVEVSIAAWFLGGAPYSACSRWRADAMAQIAALRPSLVIVSWSRWLEEPEARAMPGVPGGYGGVWQDGVAATFGFLRHAARRVAFISDIPTLGASAPQCLSEHRSDVRACTPTLAAATLLPSVKAEELALARQEGVSAIDPTSWFCTPATCPVIVGNILVYHDNSHMTKQWGRFIAPVLGAAIVPIIGQA